MKTFFAILALLLTSSSQASARLDCGAQVSRDGTNTASSPSPVCDHFAGVAPEGYYIWYDSNGIAEKYPNFVYLPGSDPQQPENGAAVHWKTDDEYVYIAVATRATGWMAFGISEAGGMIGADMAIFTAARPNELQDAYTNELRSPQVDDCSNDWELVSSHVDEANGFLMFETKRKLNTGDPQDKVIVNDSSDFVPAHRVIAAWGDQPEVGYHGLNRARGAIRFFGQGTDAASFESRMGEHAEGNFEVRSINHEISTNETEYFYTCFSRADVIAQGVPDTQDMLSIIGFEPFLSEGNEAYVHHYVVTASSAAGGSCENDEDFIEVVYVWAPGEGAFALPDFLGTPLFGNDGYTAFSIEVHYNNPSHNANVIDSSGVRVYWTSQVREEEMGILMVGDPSVNLWGQPVGNGFTQHSFECPGSCSSIVNQPVTVLREYLHMHETGARMVNQQIRNGDVIREGSVEFWEFEQNGNAAIQQDTFDILPNDGFRTTCYFDGTDDRTFGLASAEEMCMVFLYYYPRTRITSQRLSEVLGTELPEFVAPWICGYDGGIPGCDTEYEMTELGSAEDFGRRFATQDESCGSNAPTDDDNDDSAASSTTTRVVAASALLLLGLLV